jgi:hypothetical protein
VGESMDDKKAALGLHLWATLVALGPITLFLYGKFAGWSFILLTIIGIIAAGIAGIHFNIVRGGQIGLYKGQQTSLLFLVQMLLVCGISFMTNGILRNSAFAFLAFCNLVAYSILNKAVQDKDPFG